MKNTCSACLDQSANDYSQRWEQVVALVPQAELHIHYLDRNMLSRSMKDNFVAFNRMINDHRR